MVTIEIIIEIGIPQEGVILAILGTGTTEALIMDQLSLMA